MTQFIGNQTSQDTLLVDDYPLGLRRPRLYMLPDVQSMVPKYRDDCSVYSYQNPYWPGNGGLIGCSDMESGIYSDVIVPVWWDQPDVVTGHAFGFGFVGISRDQYGSPLAGVTVKLFHTTDNVLIDQEVSDAAGNYTLITPYLDAHYIVAQKTSALVSGATLDNLIPAT